MTIYDKKHAAELEHAVTVHISITSENRHKDGSPMVCWSLTKTNVRKDQQSI